MLRKAGCLLYRRFPNLLYRRFPNRQTNPKAEVLDCGMVCGLGNPRYSRLGSLRYATGVRLAPGRNHVGWLNPGSVFQPNLRGITPESNSVHGNALSPGTAGAGLATSPRPR